MKKLFLTTLFLFSICQVYTEKIIARKTDTKKQAPSSVAYGVVEHLRAKRLSFQSSSRYLTELIVQKIAIKKFK